MKFIMLFLTCYFAQPDRLYSQYIPGQTYWGTNNYIEYRAGALPIIISAPHGGTLEPASIPDRTCADCVIARDLNTLELAQITDTVIQQIFGCQAHIVISHLHRKKLDINREIVNAAQGNAEAELAYNEYHNFLATAQNTIMMQQQKGILIDLHGHGHTIQRLELGYLLYADELRLNDSILALPPYPGYVGISNLVDSNINQYNLPQLLRGQYALGSLLRTSGYPAVPSDNDPAPAVNDPYFSGGYIANLYGSIASGTLDAIQIETNYTGVRNTPANRQAFATALANSLKTYLLQHYFSGMIPCAMVLSSSEVERFDVHCAQNQIIAEWSADNESSTGFFTLQGSENGLNWQNLIQTEARPHQNNYNIIDDNTADNHYFRLLTVGKDGSKAYSPVRWVSCQATDYDYYPNPARAGTPIQVRVSNPYYDIATIVVYNQFGQVVYQDEVRTDNLQIPGLEPGMYAMSIFSAGRITTQRMVVQR